MARIRIDDRGSTELTPADVEAGVGEGGGERSPRTSGEALSGVVGTALNGGGVCGNTGEKMEMGRGGVEVILTGASAVRECVSWDRQQRWRCSRASSPGLLHCWLHCSRTGSKE